MAISDQLRSKLSAVAPNLLRMRESGIYFTMPKVLDSWAMAESKRWVCLDPDVLFFDRPDELLDFLDEGNDICRFLWNQPADRGHADGTYCWQPEEVRRASGIDLPVPFCIGCGAVDSEGFDWLLAEKLFSTLQVPSSRAFMVDQTLMGVFAVASGFTALDRKRYSIEEVSDLNGVVARHYAAKSRDFFYVEGLRVIRSKFSFSESGIPRRGPSTTTH